MEELVQIVASKTGISEDQARVAIQAVITHLEARLSPTMAGILNTLIETPSAGAAGPSPVAGEAEGILKSVVGKFFQ